MSLDLKREFEKDLEHMRKAVLNREKISVSVQRA